VLRSAHHLRGFSIGASDGPIGTVSDFLFDDQAWLVRWLVVDTGHILPGRKVLLPPSILGNATHVDHRFSVRLTKAEVEASPGLDTDAPVSRRMEADTYDYYGWSPYWNTGFYFGGFGYAGDSGGPASLAASVHEHHEMAKGDQHLRSVRDGDMGHVADLLIEDGDWGVRYLVVDTNDWWPGRKVLISPRSVHAVEWLKRAVTLDVDRAAVKHSPAYDEGDAMIAACDGNAMVHRVYEGRFHDHW
jgi:hypothetical protein